MVEAPYELRRHPEATRLTWLAAFAHLRGRAITDTLTDLLVDTIHRINAKADRPIADVLRRDKDAFNCLKRAEIEVDRCVHEATHQ